MRIKQLLANERTVYLLIIVLSLAALIPYIAACFYIHPNMDDWAFSYRIQEHGRIGFPLFFYYTWSGRFFAFFLLAIPKAHILTNASWYAIMPIFFIGITWLINYKLIGLILTGVVKKVRIIALSLFFTAFYFTGLPEVFSALYWNCSSYYLIGNVFFLWLVYEIANYMIAGNSIKSLSFLKAAILCFLVCGLTEIYIISLAVVFGCIFIYKLFKDKNVRYDFLILALIVAVSGGINIFSPGTLERMDVSEAEKGLVSSAIRAFYDFLILQIAPLFYSGFLMILLLVFLSIKPILQKKDNLKQFFGIHPLISLFVILFIFYLHHAASVYGAGYTIQGRVLNFTNLIFYFSLLFVLINCIVYFDLEEINIGPKIILPFVLLIAAFSMNFSLNSRLVIKELAYDLPTFDNEMNNRYTTINDAIANGQKQVFLTRLSVHPKIFSLGAYDQNRNYYNSKELCSEMSLLFGIEIKLEGDQYDIIE